MKLKSKIWIISDTHFNHANFLTFKDDAGKLIRPFDNVETLDQMMIDNWNSVVGTSDIVYHLGDVGFNKGKLDKILPKLKGKKRLILGNHDAYKMSWYEKHFSKISVTRTFGSVILSHYPIYLDDRYEINIHGHIHHHESPTPKHFNACVEKTNYTPILLDDIVKNCKRFIR